MKSFFFCIMCTFRWGIWVDCSKWWLDHFDQFRKFIEQGGDADQNEVLLKLLREVPEEKKATMAFAIAHTEELVNLINFTQKTSEPIGIMQFNFPHTSCSTQWSNWRWK